MNATPNMKKAAKNPPIKMNRINPIWMQSSSSFDFPQLF